MKIAEKLILVFFIIVFIVSVAGCKKNTPETNGTQEPDVSTGDQTIQTETNSPNNPDSSFNEKSYLPGGNAANISAEPSKNNPKTETPEILEAKNYADVVFREFIVNYIEGNVKGMLGTMSSPAKNFIKEEYAAENNIAAENLSDDLLIIYMLQSFSDRPEPGSLIYSVDCKVEEYYEKDTYEYIDVEVNYFNGDAQGAAAFAKVDFSVKTGENTYTGTGLVVLIDGFWKTITTKLMLPL